MIRIGLAISEASSDLIVRSVREHNVPAPYHSHQLFTLTFIDPQLDQSAYRGAKFLENGGFRAYRSRANIPRLDEDWRDWGWTPTRASRT